jgi:acyl carrier protein
MAKKALSSASLGRACEVADGLRADSSQRGQGHPESLPGSSPSGRNPEEVAHALTAFVNDRIMARGRPIRPDDDLEAAGVDSMALLKVLLFVEAEFGFWIPDEDLLATNIASLRALAGYICRQGYPS